MRRAASAPALPLFTRLPDAVPDVLRDASGMTGLVVARGGMCDGQVRPAESLPPVGRVWTFPSTHTMGARCGSPYVVTASVERLRDGRVAQVLVPVTDRAA